MLIRLLYSIHGTFRNVRGVCHTKSTFKNLSAKSALREAFFAFF